MKNETICKEANLNKIIKINLIDYKTSIKLAFNKIEQNQVLSSWKDALTSEVFKDGISQYLEVPSDGCFTDIRKKKSENVEVTIDKIWSIGGQNGWYSGNFLWKIRGFIDQLFGGVGLRRGRKSQTELSTGEALDFWRVLVADKANKRLLLYAEMKLPGEAWLEFKINKNNIIVQTATFRPLGLFGRIYWYTVFPFHSYIFNGMIKFLSIK
jgi:hypothetical protein